MNPFETPLKDKRQQFTGRVRQQQIETCQKSIRNEWLKTQKKKIKDKQFEQIRWALEIDCTNSTALKRLSSLFFEEGLIITQTKCLSVLHIINKLFNQSKQKAFLQEQNRSRQTSQHQNPQDKTLVKQEQAQKSQISHSLAKKAHTQDQKLQVQTQKSSKSDYKPQGRVSISIQAQKQRIRILRLQYEEALYQIIYILAYNAKNYPQYGTFNDQNIITTVWRVFKNTQSARIRRISLKFLNLLSLNAKNKQYLISQNLLKAFLRPEYRQLIKQIENLLYNFFFSDTLQLTDKVITEVKQLLMYHQELFQSENKLQQFFHFIQDFFNRVTHDLANSMNFVTLVGCLLKKISSTIVMEDQNRLFCCKIFSQIFHKISFISIFNPDFKQCCIQSFSKVCFFHQQLQNVYNKRISKEETLNSSELLQAKQLVKCFAEIFQFFMAKMRGQPEIKSCFYAFTQKALINLKHQPKLCIERSLLLKILFKFYDYFTQDDIPSILNWYEEIITDKQARICCLKWLIKFRRQEKLNDEAYFNIRKIFEQLVKDEDQDKISFFILYTLPYPSERLIASQQKKIETLKLRKQEDDEVL